MFSRYTYTILLCNYSCLESYSFQLAKFSFSLILCHIIRETGQSLEGSTNHEINDKQARKNKKKKIRDKEEKVQESVKESDIAVLPDEVTTADVNQAAAIENKSEVLPSGR